MKFSKNALSIVTFWMVSFFIIQSYQAQTELIKRQNNRIGFSSVHNIASQPYSLNNKVNEDYVVGTPIEVQYIEDALVNIYKGYEPRYQVNIKVENILIGVYNTNDEKCHNSRVEFIKT